MLGTGSGGWVGVVILSSPQAASRSRAERANAFDFIVTPPRVTDCPPDKGNSGATRRRTAPPASRCESTTGPRRRDSKAERRSRTERAGRTPARVELGGASGAPPRPPARSAGVNPAPLAAVATLVCPSYGGRIP